MIEIPETTPELIERAQSDQELQRRSKELRALNRLAHRLHNPANSAQALEKSLRLVSTLTRMETAFVLVLDRDRPTLSLAASRNLPPSLVQVVQRVPLNPAVFEEDYQSDPTLSQSLLEQVLRRRKPFVIPDLRELSWPGTALALEAGYLSGIIVPIQHGFEILGVLCLTSAQARSFTAHDQELFNGIAAQVALALHNQRLFTDMTRQVIELQAIARVGELLQSSLDLGAVLSHIAEIIRETLRASYVVFHVLREGKLETRGASDDRETQRIFEIARYERKILNTQKPLAVSDCELSECDPRQREILRKLGMRASFAVPLIVRRDSFGTLFVNHATPHEWSEEDRRLIQTFAQQITAALDNRQLLEETHNQVSDLRTLAQVAQYFAFARNPNDALQEVVFEIAGMMHADYVSIHLREGNVLHLVAESAQTNAPSELEIHDAQFGVLDRLEITRVTHCDLDAVNEAQQEALRHYGIIADLGVPLVARKEALGILYISHYRLHTWTAEEELLARTFAQQIAASLETIKLLEQTRQQAKEFEMLAQVAHAIATSPSPEATLPQAARTLRQVLKADHVGFQFLEDGKFRMVTESNSRLAHRELNVHPYHRKILQSLEPLVVNDYRVEAHPPKLREVMERVGFSATVGVPLYAHRTAFGVLFVSQEKPRYWTPRELKLIQTFANQVSAVFANSRLLQEKDARARELLALSELAELASSLLSENEMVDLALEEIRQMFGANAVAVNLMDGDYLRPARANGLFAITTQPYPLTPELQHVLNSKELIIIDPQHHPMIDGEVRQRLIRNEILCSVIAPLYTAQTPLGFLLIGYRQTHTFTPQELALIQAATSQLAVALNNARFFEAHRRRAEKHADLNAMVQECSLIRDEDQLLQTVIERARTLLDATAASIRLVEGDHLTVGYSCGYADEAARNHPIKIDGLLRHALADLQPYTSSDIRQDRRIPDSYRARQAAQGFAALLMAPMWADRQAIGLLTIFKSEPHAWTEAEQQYAQTVANAIALMLTGVRLLKTSQLQRDQLEAILNSVFSGVLTTDAQGNILLWNRAAQAITGFTQAQMRGKNWVVDGPRVGTSRYEDSLVFEALHSDKVEFSYNVRYLTRADGKPIELREVAAPLHDAAGKPSGGVVAFWDRALEKQGEIAKLDLLAEKGHTVTHDLDLVVLCAEALADPQLDPDKRRVYTQALLGTTQDLRELQKQLALLQQDKFREESLEEPVDLQTMVQEFRAALKARRDQHQLRLEGQWGLVSGDPARLRTILYNVLDNAVRYSPPRSRIRISTRTLPDQRLELAIHNTGEPIPEAVLKRLSEPGVRGVTQQAGTGLGLWIVRMKLRELGGDLAITSLAREGTTVRLTLKLYGSPR